MADSLLLQHGLKEALHQLLHPGQWSPPRGPPASKCWTRDLSLVTLEPGSADLHPNSSLAGSYDTLEGQNRGARASYSHHAPASRGTPVLSPACLHSPPLHRHHAEPSSTPEKAAAREDTIPEQGPLAPPQMLFISPSLPPGSPQAAPAHADPSLAGGGTIGLSSQASLRQVSSLPSNGAHTLLSFSL